MVASGWVQLGLAWLGWAPRKRTRSAELGPPRLGFAGLGRNWVCSAGMGGQLRWELGLAAMSCDRLGSPGSGLYRLGSIMVELGWASVGLGWTEVGWAPLGSARLSLVRMGLAAPD